MKKIKFILPVLVSIFMVGCMQSRYITERFIKTNIENHNVGEFSSIKTFTIFKGTSFGGGSYLELAGYKYGTTKGLVIGADKYYLARQKFKGDNTIIAQIEYIELSFDQCNSILGNYSELQDKISAEKPRMNEEIYHDYTVSKDLFISYRKSSASNSLYIDLWIKGEKYSIATSSFINKLNKFIEY